MTSKKTEEEMQKAVDAIHEIFAAQFSCMYQLTQTIEHTEEAISSAKKMLGMPELTIDKNEIQSALRAFVQQMGEPYLEHEEALMGIFSDKNKEVCKTLLNRIRSYQTRTQVMREIMMEYMEKENKKDAH